jgi:hypothetical protein
MVTTKLWAGLGNQLFMIANVIAYAKRWNLDHWIPDRTLNPRIWPTYFTNLPKLKGTDHTPYKLYKEPSHAYHEIPYMQHVMFEGFFQSHRYFEDQREEVHHQLNFPWKPLQGFVSVHVRRGDYLQYADKHPVVTIDYLRDAIMTFINKGYKSFVVISDDPSWCRKNLDFLKIYDISFSYSVNKTPVEDLALGSCCEHNIGSNSTFSWWIHELNKNPDKIGIFPNLWFGPGNSHLSTKDIYPPNAIIL